MSGQPGQRSAGLLLTGYALVGIALGVLLVKSEIVSWFRIQEMFRFHAFHMYGILGSALAVSALSLRLLRRFGVRTLHGEEIRVAAKELGAGTRYWLGGLLFGLGWALTGVCPGPIFAMIGSGVTVFAVVLLGALAGAWVYAHARPYLPH